MRLDEKDLMEKVRKKFAVDARPSARFEENLFRAAEEILSVRRELVTMRDRRRAEKMEWRRVIRERVAAVRLFEFWAEPLRLFILSPYAQLSSLAVILSFVFYLELSSKPGGGRPSDLAEFPKMNTFPAEYDAQRAAERQAYEREAEYERLQTTVR